MYVWRGRETEGGYVPKCKAAYSQGREVKKFDFMRTFLTKKEL